MSHRTFAMSGATGTPVPANGEGVTVFELGDASCLMPGPEHDRCGMASVHLDVYDEGEPITYDPGTTPNAVLKALVRYGTRNAGYGEAGGEFRCDLTRGRVFAVGGADSITISAFFISGVTGEPIRPYVLKKVRATVHWPTSISPKEIRDSLPAMDLTAVDGVGVPSAFVKIPRQATAMLVQTPSPALLPTLLAEFTHTDVAGFVSRFATLNPNANGTLIEGGVEFVRFTSPSNMRVVPIFDLAP